VHWHHCRGLVTLPLSGGETIRLAIPVPELQEELSKDDYCMPIIFLSAHGDVATAAQAMKRGAVDFLTKPVDREELLNAIRVSLAKDAQN
jgi:FixJ family two-component response regulator